MTKAIIGSYAFAMKCKQDLRNLGYATTSPEYQRLYAAVRAIEQNYTPYYSLINILRSIGLNTNYKICFEKDDEFIIANTLIEALLVYYKDQNKIISKIYSYYGKMTSSSSDSKYFYANRYSFMKKLLEAAAKYPETYKNRLVEFELIFDAHIYPIFLDQNYSVNQVKDILAQSSNLRIEFTGDSFEHDLDLKGKIISYFSKSATETAKVTAQAKYEELKPVTAPIVESTNGVVPKANTNLEDLISDKIHEHFDESITQLSIVLANELKDYIKAQIDENMKEYKKTLEDKFKDLFS